MRFAGSAAGRKYTLRPRLARHPSGPLGAGGGWRGRTGCRAAAELAGSSGMPAAWAFHAAPGGRETLR